MDQGKLTIHQLFKIYCLNPQRIKLVRHGNKELPVLDTYHSNLEKFESYQSFQGPNRFKNADHIAVFAPGRGTSALFLGLWDVSGYDANEHLTDDHHAAIKRFSFPSEWHEIITWYNLKRNPVLDEFSERLIIDWGGSTVSWIQIKDKEILELKGKGSIGDFTSYEDVQLDFSSLKRIMDNNQTNFTWVSALRVVNGVYLIKEKTTGKQYVGSAYGDNGIYGRWSDYARTGHGGNIELKSLDPHDFEFSILEIVSNTTSVDMMIEKENRWKRKLGTREFGLNKN
jgi:hypothetical protein